MDAATNKRAVAPFDGLVGFYDFDRAPAPAVVAGHARPRV
jgi:hypothetical protein